MVNTLLKDGQLKIVLGASIHIPQLLQELSSLSEETVKRHRIDDCTDALRYAISLVPFRLKSLKDRKTMIEKVRDESVSPRMAFYKGLDRKGDPFRDMNDEELGPELLEAIDYFEEFA